MLREERRLMHRFSCISDISRYPCKNPPPVQSDCEVEGGFLVSRQVLPLFPVGLTADLRDEGGGFLVKGGFTYTDIY